MKFRAVKSSNNSFALIFEGEVFAFAERFSMYNCKIRIKNEQIEVEGEFKAEQTKRRRRRVFFNKELIPYAYTTDNGKIIESAKEVEFRDGKIYV